MLSNVDTPRYLGVDFAGNPLVETIAVGSISATSSAEAMADGKPAADVMVRLPARKKHPRGVSG